MLERCSRIDGFATALVGEPRFQTYHDVLHVPLGPRGHIPVIDAGCFHGLPTVPPSGGADSAFLSSSNPDQAEFDGHLAEHGLDVSHPETLSLADQIAVSMQRSVVCGRSGSAMHTYIFTSANHLNVLDSSDDVCSSPILFDRANKSIKMVA